LLTITQKKTYALPSKGNKIKHQQRDAFGMLFASTYEGG
jgi:hypothetical protein